MAPVKKAAQSNGGILGFFKPFSIPRHKWLSNEELEEEIVVAEPTATTLTDTADARDPRSDGQLVTDDRQQEEDVSTPHDDESQTLRLPSQPSPPRPEASSFSTLTSVPASSGTSSLPISSTGSSRRVIKDGLKGISNSDSDDSSEDELADINSFYKPKTALPIPSKMSIAGAPDRPTPQETVNRKRKSLSSRPVSPPKKKYKNSLANLVKDYKRDQIAQASIASMEEEVKELRRKDEELANCRGRVRPDSNALLATAGSDGETRERLAMALERTEALQDEECFYFFRGDSRIPDPGDFPFNSLPDEPWRKLYNNDVLREEFCVSGFAAELAAQYPLPVVVTSWMGEQLLCETDVALCEAYVEIFKSSCGHHTSVSDRYASLNAIYHTRSICESWWSEEIPDKLPPGLTNMVRLASICAPAADSIVPESLPSWTTTLFLDLALMNVDEYVRQDIHLSITIGKSIEKILDCLSEAAFHSLLSTVVQTLYSSGNLSRQVRCRCIRALPANTRRAYEIRRRLALECFSTVTDRTTSANRDWAQVILDCISTDPDLRLSSSTNYSLLKDLIAVLDIAISSGWTDWSKMQRADPSDPAAQRPPMSAAERHHNEYIDLICHRLKAIWSQIKDAGTTHLRRMEAKDAVGLLMKRLEHSVRSRPKPKKGIFDGISHDGTGMRQTTLGRLEVTRRGGGWQDSTSVMKASPSEGADDSAAGGLAASHAHSDRIDVKMNKVVGRAVEHLHDKEKGVKTRFLPP